MIKSYVIITLFYLFHNYFERMKKTKMAVPSRSFFATLKMILQLKNNKNAYTFEASILKKNKADNVSLFITIWEY